MLNPTPPQGTLIVHDNTFPELRRKSSMVGERVTKVRSSGIPYIIDAPLLTSAAIIYRSNEYPIFASWRVGTWIYPSFPPLGLCLCQRSDKIGRRRGRIRRPQMNNSGGIALCLRTCLWLLVVNPISQSKENIVSTQ